MLAQNLKKKLLKIYFFGNLPKEKVNHFQKIARDVEWKTIEPYIKKDGSFLDVGCGAGYSMNLAIENCQCKVFGIDPEPIKFGVGRNESENKFETSTILKGTADNLPFQDKSMNTIYSSHVLEHIENKKESLIEIKRVLKDDGVLIMGMPTSSMATINMFSQFIFTTHIKIMSVLFSSFFNLPKYKFKNIFLPVSHSFSNQTVFHDIFNYREKKWKSILSKEFTVNKILKPALYPYPDFRQFFKIKKNFPISSSIFFILTKKD